MLQLAPTSVWRTHLNYIQRLCTLLCIGVLAYLLTACGNAGFPSNAVVEQAVARQVEQIQQPLSRQLKLPAPSLKDIRISHLQITDRATTLINGEKTYRLGGKYDLTLKQKDQQTTQLGDVFDVYLQPQKVGKSTTWQIAQKNDGSWKLEALPTKK